MSEDEKKIINNINKELNIDNTKDILLSKTFWINLIAIGAIAVQIQTGFIISPAHQAIILSAVNILLRRITNKPVVWHLKKEE